MALDPYSACPGGTGKKIKFCCPDLISELGKIEHMLEAEQLVGCLEYIEGLEQKHPDRACLLSVKALLAGKLDMPEVAEATLSRYSEKYPQNAVALAEKATLVATRDGGRAAVDVLQQAIEAAGVNIPLHLYQAIGVVAEALLSEGQILAARGHLMLQLAIGVKDDQEPLKLVATINHSPAVPLLFKQDPNLLPAPDDAPWKTSLNSILERALHGAWRTAAKQLGELAQKAGDAPLLWKDLATLRGWLADNAGAAEALRRYSATQIPLEDAVEAEALAQLLSEEAYDEIDVLSIPYVIRDFEKLAPRLASSGRAVRIPVDLRQLASEDQPPPKEAFWLLDRATPATGVGIERKDVPRVIGRLFLFGKQTDREARLELVTHRSGELAESQVGLGEIAGDALGPAGPEEVNGQADAVLHLLSSNWRFPQDTPPEHRAELIAQERRAMLLERWPEMPQRTFGGRAARTVAGDPAMQVKLLAAILILEMSTEQSLPDFNFNELRSALKLPTLGSIDPWKTPPADVSLVRLARLDVTKLSDDDLLYAYQRAEHFRHLRALKKLAPEVIARPTLDKKTDKAQAHGLLAQLEPDGNRALLHLENARQAAQTAGASCGPWDVAELSLRLSRGEVEASQALFEHLRSNHMREPVVAQTLFQVLSDACIINPDGTFATPPSPEPAGLAVPGGAAAEPGKIWTPGGDPATAGKKSTIWTPGMD